MFVLYIGPCPCGGDHDVCDECRHCVRGEDLGTTTYAIAGTKKFMCKYCYRDTGAQALDEQREAEEAAAALREREEEERQYQADKAAGLYEPGGLYNPNGEYDYW